MALDARTTTRLVAACSAAALRVLHEAGVKAEAVRDESGVSQDTSEIRLVVTVRRSDVAEGARGAD